jgi:hypothetical protein
MSKWLKIAASLIGILISWVLIKYGITPIPGFWQAGGVLFFWTGAVVFMFSLYHLISATDILSPRPKETGSSRIAKTLHAVAKWLSVAWPHISSAFDACWYYVPAILVVIGIGLEVGLVLPHLTGLVKPQWMADAHWAFKCYIYAMSIAIFIGGPGAMAHQSYWRRKDSAAEE